MRKVGFVLFFLLLCFVQPQKALAHVGGGPPFLMIDGKYVQTDPYYIGNSTINIPQDYNNDQYVVSTPIDLKIDLSKLLVPPSIAQNSTYRWTIQDTPKTVVKTGKEITYQFSKPGSYMIVLDVLAPGESQYVNIDTTQIDVLPNADYKKPVSHISVATDSLQSNKPIAFIGSTVVDPSTQIQSVEWDFGDENSANTATALHTYATFSNYTTYFVIFRAIDKTGIISDTGIIVESIKGKLVFVDKNGNKNAIPIKTTLTANPQTPDMASLDKNEIIIGILILGGIIVLAFFIIRVKVKRKKR